MITIWGLAKGRDSTNNCARGAFTSRNYSTREAAEQAYPDWTIVLYLVEMGKRTSWGPMRPFTASNHLTHITSQETPCASSRSS